MDSFLSMLDSIPEDSIAVTVYLLGSLLILWCWYSIATRLPKLLGGITWMMIFAIWSNLSLILFVMGVGLVIGFFWSKYVANKTKVVVSNNHSPL